MRDTDLAWLAGFWDGEGTITLFSNREKTGNLKIKPSISVVNTDIGLINKARKILEELGCSLVLHEMKRSKSHHSTAYTLITGNSSYIILFLEATLPYLSGEKKERGEILLDYCRRRSEKTQRLPSAGSTPYDEEDWSALRHFESKGFRKSNNRSSTTTRETSAQDDDIV